MTRKRLMSPMAAAALVFAFGPATADGDRFALEGSAAVKGEGAEMMGRAVVDRNGERIGWIRHAETDAVGNVQSVVLIAGDSLDLQRTEFRLPRDEIAMTEDGDYVRLGVARREVATEFSAFEVPSTATHPGYLK